MKFPIINTAEHWFNRENQFLTLYSNEIELSENDLTEKYLNEEFIDSDGNIFVLSEIKNIDKNKNMTEGSIYWLSITWMFAHLKTILGRKKKPFTHKLIFSKTERTIQFDELQKILVTKIPNFHFLSTHEEELDMKAELDKCRNLEQLINLAAE